jgi:hypothetical protein
MIGYTLFKDNLYYNTTVFFLFLFFCFNNLHKKSSGLKILDLRVLFLLCFSIYTIILPISIFFDTQTNRYNYYNNDIGVNGAVVLSSIGLFGFSTALLMNGVVFRKNNLLNSNITKRKNQIFPFIFLFFLISLIIIFLKIKGVNFGFSIENGRLLTGYQTWIILNLMTTGVFFYFFKIFYLHNRLFKCLVITTFILYCYIIIFPLGGRRELISLFSLLVFYLFLKYQINFRLFLLLIATIISFLLIGVIREIDNNSLNVSSVFNYLLINNEFSIPIRHTIEYVRNQNWNLYFGLTYIYFPLLFIPRELLFGLKPYSLAWKTDSLLQIDSGAAAFHPITEAYINFSWIGPFFVFFILCFFMSYLVKHAKKYNILYLLVYMKIFDFNRGEFSLLIYEIIFIYIGYLITIKLSSFTIE